MTTVQDETACPQCGARAFVEFNCRSLVEEISCFVCGYAEHTTPTRRRTKAGAAVLRRTVHAGRGAYRLTPKGGGISQVGVFAAPITRVTVTRFKRNLRAAQLDARQSYLTRWDARAQRVVAVVGTLPREFVWETP